MIGADRRVNRVNNVVNGDQELCRILNDLVEDDLAKFLIVENSRLARYFFRFLALK